MLHVADVSSMRRSLGFVGFMALWQLLVCFWASGQYIRVDVHTKLVDTSSLSRVEAQSCSNPIFLICATID